MLGEASRASVSLEHDEGVSAHASPPRTGQVNAMCFSRAAGARKKDKNCDFLTIESSRTNPRGKAAMKNRWKRQGQHRKAHSFAVYTRNKYSKEAVPTYNG